MTKTILAGVSAALAAGLLVLTPARAAEVSIAFDDNAQQSAFQLPVLLDQCVAGVTMRSDASVCKSVAGALNGLAIMVKTAQAKAAEKADADKAKAEKKPGK